MIPVLSSFQTPNVSSVATDVKCNCPLQSNIQKLTTFDLQIDLNPLKKKKPFGRLPQSGISRIKLPELHTDEIKIDTLICNGKHDP